MLAFRERPRLRDRIIGDLSTFCLAAAAALWLGFAIGSAGGHSHQAADSASGRRKFAQRGLRGCGGAVVQLSRRRDKKLSRPASCRPVSCRIPCRVDLPSPAVSRWKC